MLGLGGYHVLNSMAVDSVRNICVATIGDRNGSTVNEPDDASSTTAICQAPRHEHLFRRQLDGAGLCHIVRAGRNRHLDMVAGPISRSA